MSDELTELENKLLEGFRLASTYGGHPDVVEWAIEDGMAYGLNSNSLAVVTMPEKDYLELLKQ